ncbi:hypothetical protein ACOMHN_043529 [Nucella lapillus]
MGPESSSFLTASLPLKAVATIQSLKFPSLCTPFLPPPHGVALNDNRNQALQLVFGALVMLCHVVMIVDMLPILTRFEPDGSHTFLPLTLLFINLAFYQLSCLSDPGRISSRNVSAFFQAFKFDDLMYKVDTWCGTCSFVKPARSKHCGLCNRCVHRFDHHCVWTNNCVGVFNLRYFLLFLLSLVGMCVNGVVVAARCLLMLVSHLQLMDRPYQDRVTGLLQPMTYAMLVQRLFYQFPRIVVLLGSLVVLVCLLTPFLLYHLYLVAVNHTTNERFKLAHLHTMHTPTPNNNTAQWAKSLAHSRSFYNKGLVGNIREVLFPQVPQLNSPGSGERPTPSQIPHVLKSRHKRD